MTRAFTSLLCVVMAAGAAAQEPAPEGLEPAPRVRLEPAPVCPDRYDVEAKFLANPDEAVLIAGVVGWCRQNQTRLIWDERYAAVARRWSEGLVQSGTGAEKLLPVDRLRFELRRSGVTDAAVLPTSVEGPAETLPPELLRFLDQEAKRGRYTHFAVGVGRTKDQQRMISTLLLGRRPAWLDPLPMCPPPGSRLELQLKLLRSYSHPRWLLASPDGKVQAQTLLYEEGAWRGTVPLDGGRGTYQMELIVQGPAGPEVAALFPLFAGVPRPDLPEVKVYPGPGRYPTPGDAAQALLKLTNQAREKAGLPALKRDAVLDKLAEEHSLELLADRHAVHRTSTTGALVDRLHKQQFPFSRALENVSLAPSPEAAHQRFMESPSHRLNLLDPNVNQIGVGVAMERGPEEDILAATLVFVEPPESGDITGMADKLLQHVNGLRKAKGRFALGMDAQLSKAAQRSARRLADLGSKADPQREGELLLQELEDSPQASRDPRLRFFRTSQLKQVLASPEVLHEDINRLGIGLARIGSGAPEEFWVTLIFAGR